MTTSLEASRASATGVVSCGGLLALLLRRLWRVQVVAATQRRRRRGHRAWVELVATWHTPLLLLGLAITIARLAFFVEIYGHRNPDTRSMRRQRLWLWLELPSALVTITGAYVLFFHAHVALYHEWPIRFGSTSPLFRILLGGFAALLLLVVWLLASGRESTDPIFLPSEWTRLSLEYFAIVWIVLGALLLKFHGQSADVMWAERGVGRLLVISPRSLHRLVATVALLALVIIGRGVMCAMLTIEAEDPGGTAPLLPADPATMTATTFLSMYGVWELVVVGVIYCLCGCVPVYSRARRLDGFTDEPASRVPPSVASYPTLHFSLPSPKQAVEDYFRSASAVLQSHSKSRASRQCEDRGIYAAPAEIADSEDDDLLLLEGDSYHEPLLSYHTEADDDEQGDPFDRKRPTDPLLNRST